MNILSFIFYCIIVTYTPGPSNIMILSITQNQGYTRALRFTAGATTAFTLLLIISALLNSLMVTVLPDILKVLQIIGSIYILYLAYQIFRMNITDSDNESSATFKSGFLMQFINPKVVLFAMTIIPGFVLPYYSTPKAIAVFVVLLSSIGLSAFLTWVLGGVLFKSLLTRFQRVTNTILGIFMIYSAIMVSGIIEVVK